MADAEFPLVVKICTSIKEGRGWKFDGRIGEYLNRVVDRDGQYTGQYQSFLSLLNHGSCPNGKHIHFTKTITWPRDILRSQNEDEIRSFIGRHVEEAEAEFVKGCPCKEATNG